MALTSFRLIVLIYYRSALWSSAVSAFLYSLNLAAFVAYKNAVASVRYHFNVPKLPMTGALFCCDGDICC